MTYNDLRTLLISLWATRRPVFVEGPPGIGKSALIREVADTVFNGGVLRPFRAPRTYFIDERASQMAPVDARGLPAVDEARDVTRWVTPEFLPRDPAWQGILFLDELPQADKDVQSAFLQLFLDRRLGSYTLPDGAWVIAAGNRPQDRSGSHRVISALGARTARITLDVDPDQWLTMAATRGYAPEVRSFIAYRRSLLHAFDPQALNSPNPRGWEFISDDLPHLGTNIGVIREYASGIVGEGAATAAPALSTPVEAPCPCPAPCACPPSCALWGPFWPGACPAPAAERPAGRAIGPSPPRKPPSPPVRRRSATGARCPAASRH